MDAKRERFGRGALVVESDDTLRRRLLPMLEEHLAAGEPVLIMVGPGTGRVVRDALGARSDRLEWRDPQAYRRPLGSVYQELRRYLREQHDAGRRVYVVVEPDAGADPGAPVDRVANYLTYEPVCHEARTGYGCPVTFLWNVDAAASLFGPAEVALPPPVSVDVDVEVLDPGDLERTRSAILAWGNGQGFSEDAGTDLVIAVSEVATNGLVHGAPPVRLRAWRHGGTLVVQVDDNGGRPIPAAAGHQRPDNASIGGLGLWLVRQLAGVVRTHTAAGRTSVRMYFPYLTGHPPGG